MVIEGGTRSGTKLMWPAVFERRSIVNQEAKVLREKYAPCCWINGFTNWPIQLDPYNHVHTPFQIDRPNAAMEVTTRQIRQHFSTTVFQMS